MIEMSSWPKFKLPSLLATPLYPEYLMVAPLYFIDADVGELIFPTRHATMAISLCFLFLTVHSSVSTSLSVLSLTQTLFMPAGMIPTSTRAFNFSFLTKLPFPPLHGEPVLKLKVGPVALALTFFSLVVFSAFFSLAQIFLEFLIAVITAPAWPLQRLVDLAKISLVVFTCLMCFLPVFSCLDAFSLAFAFFSLAFFSLAFFSLAPVSLALRSFFLAFFSLLVRSAFFVRSLVVFTCLMCFLPVFSCLDAF